MHDSTRTRCGPEVPGRPTMSHPLNLLVGQRRPRPASRPTRAHAFAWNRHPLALTAALAVIGLLTACGGGSDGPPAGRAASAAGALVAAGAPAASGETAAAGSDAASVPGTSTGLGPRRRALANSILDSNADILLDWAERSFPSLFPGHKDTLSAAPYLYRYYPETGVYVGVNGTSAYVMGGPYGSRPVRVGSVASFWSQAVTKAAETRCWNLDLMFTGGTVFEVEWEQTGPGVKPQGAETLNTHGPTTWSGEPATEFWQSFSHTDPSGTSYGGQARVFMHRSGQDSVTWRARIYMEAEVVPMVGTRNHLNGTDSAMPGRVDAHYALGPGQSATSTFELSSQVNVIGDNPADTRTTTTRTSHSVTTRVVARESVVVPAGTYATCRVEQSDTAEPGKLTTTWYATGRGLPVKRVVTENGRTVLTQRATAVRVNYKPV